MYYLCAKYYEPIIAQRYKANRVSWIPGLTLLGLPTNWTDRHAVGVGLVHM